MTNHFYLPDFDGVEVTYIPEHTYTSGRTLPAFFIIGSPVHPPGYPSSAYPSIGLEDARTLRDQLVKLFEEIDS